MHAAAPAVAQAEGAEARAVGLEGLEAGGQARAEVEAEVELVAQAEPEEPEAQAGLEAEAERAEPEAREEQVVAAEEAAPAEGRAGPGVATTITPTRIR